jgi:AcrR family transcriptional regulator
MNLRERIIENASALFFQKGVKSMTMSDIANELGVSKRTLYEVFHDKEDLLENCMLSHMAKVDKAIRSLAENSEDVIDTVMRAYGRYLNETKAINQSVIHDLKKYHSNLYKKVEQKQRENMSMFLPLFDKGVKEGLIRDDINFEIILWLVRSQFKSLMNDDYFPTDKYSINEFIQVIILNFIRGIATPSGVKKVDDIVEKMKKNKQLNII